MDTPAPSLLPAFRRPGLAPTLALLALVSLLAALRLMSPSDIDDNDQAGPMMHIIDVSHNGHWLMQRDARGKIASKPPMYPWAGAPAVIATGRTSELLLKLPSLVGFVVVTLLVLDLGRRCVGWQGATLAAAVWAASYPAFKLMYTARPDMLLAMWIVLALWAVQRQRAIWREAVEADARTGRSLGFLAVFWLAVAGAALTKGPPALLPILWLALSIGVDRSWRACRPLLQIAGLLFVVGLTGKWLLAVCAQFPEYIDTFAYEVTDRISGRNGGAHRTTSFLAVPLYFLARFAPWAVLAAIAGALALHRRNATDAHSETRGLAPRALLWAAAWVALVVVFFMIPKGRRADYLLPAYPIGAVLAAAAAIWAQQRSGWLRVGVHLALGAAAIAGLAAPVALWLAPGPNLPSISGLLAPGETLLATGASVAAGVACATALVASIATLLWIHRRLYVRGAFAAAFVLAGALGVFQSSWSSAAQERTGDLARLVARTVQEHADALDDAAVLHGLGYTPIYALLGAVDTDDDDLIDRLDAGCVLVVLEDEWEESLARPATLLLRAAAGADGAVLLVLRVPAIDDGSPAGGAPDD